MNKALKLLIDNPCLTGLNEAMQAAGFSSDSVDMQRLEWIVSSAYRSLSPSHHHYHHHTITMSDIGNNVPSSITEDVYYGTTGTTTSTTTTSQNDDSDQVLGGHAKANTNKPTDPSDVMHEEAESRRYSQPVEHEGKVGDGTVSNNSETYYYEQVSLLGSRPYSLLLSASP